jgi:hypothetical protein
MRLKVSAGAPVGRENQAHAFQGANLSGQHAVRRAELVGLFSGNGDQSRFHQPIHLGAIGGAVDVGKDDVLLAQQLELGRKDFLDLDDELGAVVNGLSRVDDPGTGFLVSAGRRARERARVAFHPHLVAERGEFRYLCRQQRDPAFLGFNLSRHADTHERFPQ